MSRILVDPKQAAKEYVTRIKEQQQKALPTVTQRLNETISRFNTNRNSLFTDQTARVTEMNDPRYGYNPYQGYRSDSAEWKQSVDKRTADIENDANTIQNILDEYEQYFDAEWVKNIREGLKSTSGSLSSVRTFAADSREYSQGLDEGRQISEDLNSGDYEKVEAASKKVIAKNQSAIDEAFKKYSAIVESEVDDYNKKIANEAPSPSSSDPIDNFIKSFSIVRKSIYDDPRNSRVTDDWDSSSKLNLYSLIKSGDIEAAKKYAADVNEAIRNENLKNFGKNHPLLGGLGTAVMTPMVTADYLANIAEYSLKSASGKEAELQRSKFSDFANSSIAGGAEASSSKIGNFDAGAFVYQTGTSMLQSLAAAPLGPLGLALLGGSAAASTTNDLLDRGASDGQAIVGGLIAGVFEGLFEKFSIGNLKAFKNLPAKVFKDYLKATAKSVVVNASEEFVTEAANIIYDTVANWDISNAKKIYNNYVKNGEENAGWKTLGQLVGQAAEAGASGALMGLFFGGGGSAYSAIKRSAAISSFAKNPEQLISLANSLTNNAEAKRLADIASNELIKKGKLSQNTLNALYNVVEASDFQIIENAIANRLAQLGVSEYDMLANTISKKMQGVELTKQEQKLFDSSKYSKQILNELNPENNTKISDIPDWVKNIGTSVVNSRLYNLANAQAESVAETEQIDGATIESAADTAMAEMTTSPRSVASQNTDGILSQITAANPPADVMKDSIAKSSGVERLSDGQKLLRKIGQSFGARVEFADLDETRTDKNGSQFLFSPEGSYDPNTNTITLNTNVKDYHRPVQFILKHELTHSLEKAGVDYEQFMGMVELSNEFEEYLKKRIEAAKSSQEFKEFEQTFANENDLEALSDFDLMIQYTIYRYNENGKPLGSKNETAETAAKKELTADFVADVLFNGSDVSLENLLKSLQPETRNKFIEAVKNIIAKLKEIFIGTSELTEIEQLEQKFLEIANKVKKMNAAEVETEKTTTGDGSGVKNSFEGYADDGKGKYKSNFPKGTPKAAKAKAILSYIQDVWSKKPIRLRVEDNGNVKYVEAQFDPTFDKSGNVPTDASKLMGGNRHGTSAEQRVTLDLAEDYYKIASESKYNYSKEETGKNNATHRDVIRWHYFINDIYFAEYDSDEYVPYRVSINVKEKADGNFVYSFSAEKQEGLGTQRTLHAVVNNAENVANTQPSSNSIPENGQPVNSNSMQSGKRYSFAGEKSLTAKKEKLEEAKRREKSSDKEESDRENIRRELDWFRGMEPADKDKWKYEIDDSNAKFNPYSFEGERLLDREEELRLKGDNLSPAEKIELESIQDQLRKRDELSHTLDEYFKHDELYAAYPQLKNTKVEYTGNMSEETKAEYNPDTNTILLNEDRIEDIDESIILEEVQHRIQLIEKFSEGSSIDFWLGIWFEIFKEESMARNILMKIEKKCGKPFVALAKRYAELAPIYAEGDHSVEQELGDIIEEAYRNNVCKLFEGYDKHKQFADNILKAIGYRKPEQLYEDTAGEIEAHDVGKRWKLTPEQRKEIRPDIDRKDFIRSEDFLPPEEKEKEFAFQSYDPQNSDVISEKTEYEKLIDELAEYLKQKNAENNGDLVEVSEPEDITAIAIDGEDGIIKNNEGNSSRESVPYQKSRPPHSESVVEEVWNNAKDSITGKVYDPSGKEIIWDRSRQRKGQWDMGHIPGQEYAIIHKKYLDGEISKEKFLEWYTNPKNYRPELPTTNRSHKYEQKFI